MTYCRGTWPDLTKICQPSTSSLTWEEQILLVLTLNHHRIIVFGDISNSSSSLILSVLLALEDLRRWKGNKMIRLERAVGATSFATSGTSRGDIS